MRPQKKKIEESSQYQFVLGDINDQALVEKLCSEQQIDAIVHFAAETHVDRSIVSVQPFLEANINGTAALLEVVRHFPHIHFHHVSTDEVYGSLGKKGFFHEESPYRPNSPYSATKAASDHLVRAYGQTYHLSTTISHCSNNYGPGQNHEKLIPKIIMNCLAQIPIPIYGNGSNIRDWIYVDDHVLAIWKILQKGKEGEVYDLGGNVEISNVELLSLILKLLAKYTGSNLASFQYLIQFVDDRPGHDFRYAIDAKKADQTLDWKPTTPLIKGLNQTISFFTNELKLLTHE